MQRFQYVYTKDDQNCGGWDIAGNIWVKGGCSGDSCSYAVTVSTAHGGVGDQCHQTTTQPYTLTFRKPKTYQRLSNLSNFNLQTGTPNFVGNAGQPGLSVAIGGQAVGITTKTTCPTNGGYCVTETPAYYSNNWNGQFNSMTYNIGLQPGDSFGNMCANFNAY